MNTRTARGVLVAMAVLALTIGACKKKPKDDKAKDGDQAAAAMKPAMTPEAMAPAKKPAMQPAMTVEAMRPVEDAPRPVAKGDGFLIKFDRPLTVGLRYRAVANGTVVSRTSLNGKPLAQKSFKMVYHYEAEVTVKAVHSSGKATQEELKIIKLTLIRDGKTKELLPQGAIVLAQAEGSKEKFSVKGKPVAKATAKVLGHVVSLFKGDTTTTDDVFGPGGPKKPGDTWKPNFAKMLDSLKSRGSFKGAALWPKPADSTGDVTFVAAKKVRGMDVFEIKAHVKFNNMAPKMGPIAVKVGTLEMQISGWVPKDPKVLIAEAKTMTMKMRAEGEMPKDGKTFKIVVEYVQSQRGSKTAIK